MCDILSIAATNDSFCVFRSKCQMKIWTEMVPVCCLLCALTVLEDSGVCPRTIFSWKIQAHTLIDSLANVNAADCRLRMLVRKTWTLNIHCHREQHFRPEDPPSGTKIKTGSFELRIMGTFSRVKIWLKKLLFVELENTPRWWFQEMRKSIEDVGISASRISDRWWDKEVHRTGILDDLWGGFLSFKSFSNTRG